jgi:O-antigen/teichoic acid export membrane protein
MRFKQIAYANISSTIFSTLLSIFLALKGFGYWALVWREVGRSSFQLIFTLILCPWIPGLPSKNTRLSKLVHIGGNITAFNLIFFISQTLDQILIGRFLGPASLGFYRQAYQLVMAPSEQIMYPINFVSESALSKLQNDPIRYRQYYVKILSALSFITIPMMLFVFIHAKDVVLALFGENWTQSIEILQILALGAVIRPILSTTGFVMLTSGKTRRYLILGAVQAIILTVALIIGLNWQLRGVSLARVIPIYLYIPTLITVSFKGTPLNANVFLKSIFPFLVSGISMLIVSSLFLSVVPLASIYSKILATLPLAVIIFLATLICFPRAKDMIKQICVDLYSSILYRQQ